MQQGLDIDGEAAFEYSGHSVSLSGDGNTLVVGALGNDNLAGHARVYDWNGSAWVQRGDNIDGEAAGGVEEIVIEESLAGARFDVIETGGGAGSEFRAPMAIVQIGGVLVATVFTLFVVPVTYDLVYRNRPGHGLRIDAEVEATQ